MTSSTKKTLTIGGFLLFLLAVGGGLIFVLPRLTTTKETVAPTAPESKPQAAEWLGGAACKTSFNIEGPGACLDLLYYVQDGSVWVATEAAKIKDRVGKDGEIRVAAQSASPSAGMITKARFKINNSEWIESAIKNPQGWFYTTVKLSSYGSYSVIAEVFDTEWRASDLCRESFDLPAAPTVTPTPTLVVTPTPTATPTPVPQCNSTCTQASDCRNTSLTCYQGQCRNPQCQTETDCVCVTPTPTKTVVKATPTPTVAGLPDAGVSLPTIGALGGGVIMVLLGILLAL